MCAVPSYSAAIIQAAWLKFHLRSAFMTIVSARVGSNSQNKDLQPFLVSIECQSPHGTGGLERYRVLTIRRVTVACSFFFPAAARSFFLVQCSGRDLCYQFQGNPAQPKSVYHLALLLEKTAINGTEGKFYTLTATPSAQEAQYEEAPILPSPRIPGPPLPEDNSRQTDVPVLHLVFDAGSLLAAAEFAGPGNMGFLLGRLAEAPNMGRVVASVPFSVLLDLDKRKDEERTGVWALEVLT
jgi:hypothetical protein